MRQAADYDAVLLGNGMPTQELPYLLTNLRADADQGHLPVLVFASKDKNGSPDQCGETISER